MIKKRNTDESCDYNNCPIKKRADLQDGNISSMYHYFDEINNRLGIGSEKMKILNQEIKKNRKWDKIILIVGLISLTVNLIK